MDLTIINIVIATATLAINAAFYIYFLKRGLPDLIQQVLNDVGPQLGKALGTPMIKRAMSVLGKESGAVRAEQATIDKFNENLPNAIPSLGLIAGQLGMEPTEIISLLNDPIIGPSLQGIVGQFMNKFLGGSGLPGQPQTPNANKKIGGYGSG